MRCFVLIISDRRKVAGRQKDGISNEGCPIDWLVDSAVKPEKNYRRVSGPYAGPVIRKAFCPMGDRETKGKGFRMGRRLPGRVYFIGWQVDSVNRLMNGVLMQT